MWASSNSSLFGHPEAMAIDEEDDIIFLLPGPGKLAMIDIASITEITRDFTKQETNTEA